MSRLFFTAAVDLDDLLNDDNWGFQAVVVHILAERYAVPKYVEDILTNPPTPSPSPDPDPVYRDAHFAARDKEEDSTGTFSGTRASLRRIRFVRKTAAHTSSHSAATIAATT